ncbi:MAG: hypothetical protein ACYC7D_11955 [Nitrososphaerales archaeon]
MSDSTQLIQKMILEGTMLNGIARINLQKGDYAVQTLEIPSSCSVELLSKDRVRILYAGKRNRPMFVLKENSSLSIKEKLEIYYNTNNIQEAMKLMIRSTQSGHFEIAHGVKISLFSHKSEERD